ncbi:hypothetical protein ACFQ6Q_17230 [Streptomyces sp. NPDC056437]
MDGWVEALPWRYENHRRLVYRGVRTAAARGAAFEAVRRWLRRG